MASPQSTPAEQWRPIPSWPYEVSDLGNVRRTAPSARWPNRKQTSFLPLRATIASTGYPIVVLMRTDADGMHSRPVAVHSLVLETFIGSRPRGLVCDHINGVRNDNRLPNLRYLSGRENILRGVGPTALNSRKTACIRGHALTNKNLYLRNGWRACRACKYLYRHPEGC